MRTEPYTCPICGEEPETLYFNEDREIIGCDCCVTSQDVGEYLEEQREAWEEEEADRRRDDAEMRKHDPDWM